MNLESLFYFIFVVFTNWYTFIDLLYFLLGFLLEAFIFVLNRRNGLFYLINFMVFVIFRVLINALHAHYSFLLFTVKHQILFVQVTLGRNTILIPWSATWVFIWLFGIIARFTTSFSYVWCFSLCPNIWKPLRICHLF